MNDNELKESFLRAFRKDIRILAHLCLIPVVALLRALSAGIIHLHDELGKI